MGEEKFKMLTPFLRKPNLNEVWLSIKCASLCIMSLYSQYVRYDSKLVNVVRCTIKSDSFSHSFLSDYL